MSQYSDSQIKQFINDKGISGNPYAMYNYAQQYGVSPGDIDRAMGYGAGTSDNWIKDQGLKGLDGSSYGGAQRSTEPVSNQQIQQFAQQKGIADNPHALQAYAQQYGVQPGQIDSAMGYAPGAAANWQHEQGFTGAPTGSPFLPGGSSTGAMTLAPNPPGGYNTSSGQTTRQTGMPSMGQYQQNTGGSPYMPMASSGPPQSQPAQSQPAQSQPSQAGMAGQNPYLGQMFDTIQQRATQNLQRNVLPAINRGAVAAGGYGGSRQGVAQGIAVGDTQRGIADAQANLGFQGYQADRNYGLQSDALDLNVYNANQNWMRQGQQDQIGLANTMLGWQGQGLNTATQAQNTPLNYFNQFTNLGAQLGGMGGTNSQTMQGNPLLGAIGGAMTGYNLYNGWNKPAGS